MPNGFRFSVLNQRKDVVFILFSNISHDGNFSRAEVIATSNVLHLQNPNEPTQGHLALTSDPRCAMSAEIDLQVVATSTQDSRSLQKQSCALDSA